MTFWLVLRRLLPLLAVLSLALAPVTASAAAASMRAPAMTQGHTMAMPEEAMDDMPCCPKERPDMPDCSKGCPLMALCLAKVATGLPGGLRLPLRIAVAAGTAWVVAMAFDSVSQGPSPEPPRS